MSDKYNHEGVGYEDPSTRPNENCGNCKHFEPPTGCEGVKSPVAASGWCLRYSKQEKSMKAFKKFIPFVKVDATKREVWGIVTAEVPDKEDEVCDYSGSKPFYEAVIAEMTKATDGKNFFPLREMHQLSAAGKCVGFEFRDADKEIFMGFKVVDDEAWKKVDEGVYTGFSQGGTIIGDLLPDPVFKGCKRYVADPSEVSLVDNPCLGVAHFAYVKADSTLELRKFKKTEEAVVIPATRLQSLIDKAELLKAAPTPTPKRREEQVAKLREVMRLAARVFVNKQLKTTPTLPGQIERLDNDLGFLGRKPRLHKGLYEAGRLASYIEDLAWLVYCAQNEKEYEDDDSELPKMLQANVVSLLETLLAMTAEETAELREQLASRVGG